MNKILYVILIVIGVYLMFQTFTIQTIDLQLLRDGILNSNEQVFIDTMDTMVAKKTITNIPIGIIIILLSGYMLRKEFKK